MLYPLLMYNFLPLPFQVSALHIRVLRQDLRYRNELVSIIEWWRSLHGRFGIIMKKFLKFGSYKIMYATLSQKYQTPLVIIEAVPMCCMQTLFQALRSALKCILSILYSEKERI
jgi:hypothetical protein